jgi:TonB family protein
MNRIARYLLCLSLLSASVVTFADVERKLIFREEPEYPDLAKQNHLHGAVRLKVWITPEGTVRRLEYIGGNPVLAQSALKAVQNWKYEKATKESTADVEIKF